MGPKGVSNAPSEPHIGPGLALFLTCVGLCGSYRQQGGTYFAGVSISSLLTLLYFSIFKNTRTKYFEMIFFRLKTWWSQQLHLASSRVTCGMKLGNYVCIVDGARTI